MDFERRAEHGAAIAAAEAAAAAASSGSSSSASSAGSGSIKFLIERLMAFKSAAAAAAAAKREQQQQQQQQPQQQQVHPARTARNSYLDNRYHSDTASLIDSSSYQDASSQRDSDQESFHPEEFKVSHRHFSSDSESEASSTIIDRFQQCETRTEKVIPRFQQSTVSTRGRQRQIERAADRSESRGPASRSGRSDSREPGLRRQTRGQSQEPGYRRQSRGESREPVSRRGESREPVSRRGESREPVSRRGESREPVSRRGESREPVSRRGESREPVTTRGEPREPVSLRGEYREHAPTRRGDSREPATTRRALSREPGTRRGISREPVVRQRGLSQEPALRNYSAKEDGRTAGWDVSGNGWAGSLRQSTDFRGRSLRSESQERGRRRSESQEPGRRRSESKEPVHGRHRRSESQGPARHYFATSNDVAEERTIRAVHAELKDVDPPDGELYPDAQRMRSEVRRAYSIDLALEKEDMIGLNGEPELRDMYVEELQESENRTQKLLAQLAEEDEARRELEQIVKNMSSDPKPKQPSKAKSYTTEREYISKELDEDALRFFDEFASISASEPEDTPAEKQVTPERPAKVTKVTSEPKPPAVPPTSEPKPPAAADRHTKTPPKSSPAKSYSTEITPASRTSVDLASSERSIRSSKSSSVNKPVVSSTSRLSNPDSSGKKTFPSWKTGTMAVNTDGVVMPWLDWEPEVGSPLFSDAMFATRASNSYPCNTIGEIDWKVLSRMIPRVPELDNVDALDELFMQRIRFHGRLEAGRIHLCRQEF